MWGKLHQFANELMAPIDDEEEEDEYYDQNNQNKHHQHTSTTQQHQQSNNKEDAFFSQTFLSQPQHSTHQQPPQHNHSSSSIINNNVVSGHKRTSSSASFGGQTTTSRDSPILMQHSASYQHLPNAAGTNYSNTLSSSPPHFKSSLLETATTFFKSSASPSSQTATNTTARTHSPYSDHSTHSVSIKSPIDNVSDGGISGTTFSIPSSIVTNNQQLNNSGIKQSSISTPNQVIHTVPPPQIPGFLLNGYKSSQTDVTTNDNPNYIHVKLFVGEEITYNDQHVEYLQSQITYLQHEIANQADRHEKEKSDLKHLLENTQHSYREQNLKLNEYIEQNRRLEYDLQQTHMSATAHISKLESSVNELANHKKQLFQTINDQDVKLQQLLTELQKEQTSSRQYHIELEKERSMARSVENQNSESMRLLQEREKELADLELALEQLQMLSGKEGSKLKQIIKQKDEEILELKQNSTKLYEQVSELDVLRQQVEQYKDKINDLESSSILVNDSSSSQCKFETIPTIDIYYRSM